MRAFVLRQAVQGCRRRTHHRPHPLRLSLLLAGLLLLGGCASIGSLPGDEAILGAGQDPQRRSDGTEPVELIAPFPDMWLPQAGDRTGIGTLTPPQIARAYRLRLDGDLPGAIRETDAALAADPGDDPAANWWLQMYRLRLLIEAARPDLAQPGLPAMEALERQVFGDNLTADQMRADLLLIGNRLAAARDAYRDLLRRVHLRQSGTSGLPLGESPRRQAYYLEVRGRSTLGMALTYLFQGQCARALAWADYAIAGQQQMLTLPDRFPYNLFSRVGPDSVQGYAWSLAVQAAARTCFSNELAPSAALFARALDHFDSVGYRNGAWVVAGLLEFAVGRSVLLPQPTYRIGVLPKQGPVAARMVPPVLPGLPAELRQRLPQTGYYAPPDRPPMPRDATHEASLDQVRLPGTGQLNTIGLPVSDTLQAALDAYLAGDGELALRHLERAEQEPQSPLSAWHLSHTRAQVQIMMGLSADAEQTLIETERLEIKALGTNLNSRALRGEARAWLGDYTAARADFQQVLDALGDWRPPVYFAVPPADPSQLAALSRAQLRALFGMAMTALMQGDAAAALPWAERTESLLDDVFYIVLHPTFQQWLAIDSDMFVGRGLNLGVMASARLAGGASDAEVQPLYERAHRFFDALEVAAGGPLVDGMRARALFDLRRLTEAASLAEDISARALARGLPDLLWQMQALRGHALLRLQRPAEAEAAYREAQQALGLVSGALASDRTKRRFGIGKEEVTLALARLSLARGDLGQAFDDLERGRALAFVDLLGARAAGGLGTAADLAGRVRELDAELRRLRLRSAAVAATDWQPQREARLLGQRRELVARLRALDSELASTLAVATADFADVQSSLATGEALAYFLPSGLAERGLHLLLIEPDSVRRVETALDESGLLRSLALMRATQGAGAAPLQNRRVRALARALKSDAWLPRNRLYVVPSGAAHYLPWGALPLPATLEVVVIPTGGWLQRVAPVDRPLRPATVLGDPEFNGTLPQLPGARSEARQVADAYQVRALLGRDATEAGLRAAVAGGVEVLHLATHGVFDAQDPLDSAVMLSREQGSEALTARELFKDPLPARLVVLSACETGLGRSEAGDDFLGLTRSFYLGGALAVVNTLWPVEDEATRDYMRVFHEHARGGDYGKAWRAARQQLRDRGQPPSVYGAFVLNGSAGRDRPPRLARGD